MKTITLTKSEIETLTEYLWCNPCSARCFYDYKIIDCDSTTKDGEYSCKFMRDTYSILEKLGELRKFKCIKK